MNKALEGEATSGLIDLGSLVKVIAFIALLVMNIVSLVKISSLNTQISNTESNLLNQINYLRSQISSINSEMGEYYDSQRLIQYSSYILSDVDLDSDTYSFDIEFSLLEKETDADVYLVVEYDGASETTLLTSNSLTFSETIDLVYQTNPYTISVMIEGENLIQKELFDIRVFESAERVIQTQTGIIESEDDLVIFAYVPDEIYLVDNISINSVTIKFFEEDVLEKTETITTSSSFDTLLEPYEGEAYGYRNDGLKNVFASFYTSDASKPIGSIRIELTIHLSNGSTIDRTLGEKMF